MGTTYRVTTSRHDSGGAISVVDSVAPAGFGPPRHIHGAEDEVLFVLTGRIRWWLAGKTGFCGPGESVFIPRGVEHTWQAIGDVPCRHLVIVTPGGLEEFFLEMAAADYRIPEDMGAVGESAARHHLTFTGPPLVDADFRSAATGMPAPRKPAEAVL